MDILINLIIVYFYGVNVKKFRILKLSLTRK
jgi:hypothetical protein